MIQTSKTDKRIQAVATISMFNSGRVRRNGFQDSDIEGAQARLDQAELIDQPLLMMVGDISDTRYMTEGVFEKAIGTEDKELVLIPGANHIETYWKTEYVQQELDELADFFGAKLAE